MLTFAVVSSRGTGPLAPELQHRITTVIDDGTLDDQLVFPVARRTAWYNHDRSIAILVWTSGFDPFGAGDPWHSSEDSFTAFSGHAWPRGRGWQWTAPWAPQLAGFCRRADFPGSVEDLSGTFTAVHVESTGPGCVFADPFSIGNVYAADRATHSVHSSRAAIAAGLATVDGREPPRDPLGVGWLGFAGVVVDDVTGFEGVTLLPQCARIELDGSGRSVVRAAVHPAHRHPSVLPAEEAVALARADLDAELTALSTLAGPELLADLTGGKDSRLILAGMISAGVADRFGFWTAGRPDHPDIRLSDRLVEMFGLRRAVPGPLPIEEAVRWCAPEEQDAIGIYRRFSFGTSGMGTLWNATPIEVPSMEVKLNGVGGEPWYTNYPGSGKLTRVDQFHRWLYDGQKIGSAGLVTPDARAHYETAIEEVAGSICEGARTPQDAVDKYYLRVRMRRWFGTGQEVDRWNRVFPLFSAPGVAAAFALGPERRHAQFLPYSIMATADSRLVTTPFSDDVWPEALVEFVDGALLTPDSLSSAERPVSGTGGGPRRPGEAPRQPKLNAIRDSFAAAAPGRLETFRELVVDDPSNPLFDVLDRNAVRRAVDGYADLPHLQKQQVFGAFTAGLWLGRHEQRLYDAPSTG